jgi:hypothetical protein
MRIVTYSDLHLEFGSGWVLPADLYGDVMILASDIITFKDYAPLENCPMRDDHETGWDSNAG